MSHPKVTTAVILTAGYGTRMLPVTSAVQKVLLPILDRPVVDYVVADCVAAGIKRIIFVISPGTHGLQDYYVGNRDLDDYLRRGGKSEALYSLERIRGEATFEFVEQPPGDYGTAIPVRIALDHLQPDEAALISEGDSFIWHEDGTSEVANLVKLFEQSGADGAAAGYERPTSDLHKYGVFKLEKRAKHEYMTGVIEKPAPGEAPSNLVNISRWILTPKLFKYVRDLKPDERLGEYLLTDVFDHAVADGHEVVLHRSVGTWLDAGKLQEWLNANIALGRARGMID